MKFLEFPQTGPITPLELYKKTAPLLDAPDITYITHPITSSFARRIDNLSIEQVVEQNSKWGDAITLYLLTQGFLPDTCIILPTRAGKRFHTVDGEVKPWREYEWNLYWSMVFPRISTEESEVYIDHMNNLPDFSRQLFNDHAVPREIRLVEYQKFVDGIKVFLPKLSYHPIQRMTGLLDAVGSLGSWFERQIGAFLKIPYQVVKIDESAAGYEEWVDNFPDSVLFRHLLQNQDFRLANFQKNGSRHPLYLTAAAD